MRRAVRKRFAYALGGLHFGALFVICVKDMEAIVQRIGLIDFPLTLLASPILMNVDVSPVWVVLYYAIFGTLMWYGLGRLVDKVVNRGQNVG